ncbi:MAG: glycosyltransferase family 2 protein [Chitinophagaceae bacterium]|nr:glycosyltransferase family 2 protein [Chitinophagaceae bacterium]
MDLSIIIPLYNEDESLPELCNWIETVVTREQLEYEVILIDDGSTDQSWNVIESIAEKNSCFKAIRFRRNYGKSAALNEGFKAATGAVVITMDADMQDSPDEIPGLRNMIVSEGFDMVSGWKKVRYDNTFTKNIPSKLYNAVARKSSGIQLNDFNCGLKAYKLDVVKCIEVYGEMHRYIPILAKWSGFRKIGEKVVEHRKRKYGVTKFGWQRFVNGFLDLATIMFLGKFGKRPMQLFGLWGTLFFLIGLSSSIYLIVSKFIDRDFALTNRPAFFIALTTMIMGLQLFLAGFIAELIARNAPERNIYLIHKKIGIQD